MSKYEKSSISWKTKVSGNSDSANVVSSSWGITDLIQYCPHISFHIQMPPCPMETLHQPPPKWPQEEIPKIP